MDRQLSSPGHRDAYHWAPPEDEISLFDIWDALLRRRWLIVGIASAVTLLAVTYAFRKPDVYPYSTAIEIGRYVDAGGESRLQFLENPDAVKHKLEQAYVPGARRAIDRPEEPAPRIEVRTEGIGSKTGSGSGLFVLHTEANPEIAPRVQAAHQGVVQELEAAHERLLAPIEARQRTRLEQAEEQLAYLQSPEVKRSRIEPLEQKVATAERKLEALETRYETDRLNLDNKLAATERKATTLEDRHTKLQEKLERVDDREALLEQQLASQRELLSELERARGTANGAIASSADAMTLLTVSAQMDRARNRADSLEQQLRVGLAEDRAQLQANLLDNELAQEDVADKLGSLQNQLAELQQTYDQQRAAQQETLAMAHNDLQTARADYDQALSAQQRAVNSASIALQELSPTKALFVAEQGLNQTGTSGKVIAALGVVLGAMLGAFAAFFAEFVQAARRHREEVELQTLQADSDDAPGQAIEAPEESAAAPQTDSRSAWDEDDHQGHSHPPATGTHG